MNAEFIPEEIPVTRRELEAEATRIIERGGMPTELTWFAHNVLGYLAEHAKRHQPRQRYRMGKPGGWVCAYDNHRWPCADRDDFRELADALDEMDIAVLQDERQ